MSNASRLVEIAEIKGLLKRERMSMNKDNRYTLLPRGGMICLSGSSWNCDRQTNKIVNLGLEEGNQD